MGQMGDLGRPLLSQFGEFDAECVGEIKPFFRAQEAADFNYPAMGSQGNRTARYRVIVNFDL